MHVPIKMDYAVRALVDLALHGEDRPVRASEIALRAMVPAQYLAQVMHNLSRSDIVKSQRGPQGGHYPGGRPIRGYPERRLGSPGRHGPAGGVP